MQYLETILFRYDFKQSLCMTMSKRGCLVLVKQQRFKTKPIKYSAQALIEKISFIDELLMFLCLHYITNLYIVVGCLFFDMIVYLKLE